MAFLCGSICPLTVPGSLPALSTENTTRFGPGGIGTRWLCLVGARQNKLSFFFPGRGRQETTPAMNAAALEYFFRLSGPVHRHGHRGRLPTFSLPGASREDQLVAVMSPGRWCSPLWCGGSSCRKAVHWWWTKKNHRSDNHRRRWCPAGGSTFGTQWPGCWCGGGAAGYR